MGCSIHLHTEIKINGQWHHHSEARVERNYLLFAKMAGVRNYFDEKIEPICKPRGIPEDATLLTKLDVERYGVDGHSHSWFNAKQIAELKEFTDNGPESWFGERVMFWYHNFPYCLGNAFYNFVQYPENFFRYGIEDVRFVFFFDN